MRSALVIVYGYISEFLTVLQKRNRIPVFALDNERFSKTVPTLKGKCSLQGADFFI